MIKCLINKHGSRIYEQSPRNANQEMTALKKGSFQRFACLPPVPPDSAIGLLANTAPKDGKLTEETRCKSGGVAADFTVRDRIVPPHRNRGMRRPPLNL